METSINKRRLVIELTLLGKGDVLAELEEELRTDLAKFGKKLKKYCHGVDWDLQEPE